MIARTVAFLCIILMTSAYAINPLQTIDSCIIEDTDGDGNGDKVTSFFDSDPTGWEKYEYSWPTPSNFKTADPSQVTVSGNNLIVSDTTLVGGESSPPGKVKIKFPSIDTLIRNIEDRIGPVIVSVALSEKVNDGDPDTLVVTCSELLFENLMADSTYLNINGTPTASDSVFKFKRVAWKFIFAAGTVFGNDSVNFVHNSGLTDFFANPPLENNRKVVIEAPTGVIDKDQDYQNSAFFLKPYSELSGSIVKLDISLQRENMDITVELFNVKGNKIASLYNGMANSAFKTIYLNKREYPTGIYFVKIKADNIENSVKIRMLK